MPRKNRSIAHRDRWEGMEDLKRDLGLRGRASGRKPTRGDVWFTDLGKRGSHVQEGTRPCVVVSAGAGIARVVPVTSRTGSERMKEHVPISEEDLEDVQPLEPFSAGTALAEQVTTVAEDAFHGYMGKISWDSRKMLEIGQALKYALCLR